VHAYQWSHGTFNDGTGINKLDALNFYAYNEGGTCEYYMDDFIIEQVEIPNPPTNFTIEVVNDNDVNITWDVPEDGTPDSYSVIRDGEEIAIVDDGSEYLDENLYPGEYVYQLKAYYGEGIGYSASAGSENAMIEGGNQRQLVLFELFTGTWCPHCPTAAQAVDMMDDENLDIAIIEYHGLNGDPFETQATSIRTSFYLPFYDSEPDGALGYPTTIINGMMGMEGALTAGVAAQNELYDYYYEDYIDIPTVFTIDAEIEFIGESPYVFDINVNIEETMAFYDDEIRLFVALTETNIPYNWQGGLDEVNFVLRNMLPNANGTLLDFSSQSVISETFQLTVDDTYNINKCELVIFVQNMNNAHIMEVIRMSLADFVGINTTEIAKISIYPNPANNNVSIIANSNIISVNVLNITGQTILSIMPNTNSVYIDTEHFSSGVYSIQLETEKGVVNKSLLVE
jgi:thiol-disulfide isomerase/thioredoxin